MKTDLNDCLKLIESEKIRNFVKKALSEAPAEFWEESASSSGKHHPPEDQIKGGIIIHSRKAIQVALSLFRFFEIRNQLAKDKIIAACILHDIKKGGIPWGRNTDYEHGPITARWLKPMAISIVDFWVFLENQDERKPFNLDPDLRDIIDLVRNHMAIWNRPEPTPALIIGGKITEKRIWHLIVQLADYWASRKWCPFVCDEFEV